VPVVTLFIGGILIIGIEMYFKKLDIRRRHEMASTIGVQKTLDSSKKVGVRSLKQITYKDAIVVGLIQSISMIPGVSRSAASIFGGMALRLDREAAVEFSFLLAIPTMAAATGLDIVKSAQFFTSIQIIDLIIGTVIAFITALIIIRWLLIYIQKNNFIGFGIYRIILSIIYYLIFLR
jgi:undecaprenyl-diphosphatase